MIQDPSSWSDISHFSGCYDDRADTEHMGGWGSGRLNRPLPNLSGYSLNIQRVEGLSRREMCYFSEVAEGERTCLKEAFKL